MDANNSLLVQRMGHAFLQEAEVRSLRDLKLFGMRDTARNRRMLHWRWYEHDHHTHAPSSLRWFTC